MQNYLGVHKKNRQRFMRDRLRRYAQIRFSDSVFEKNGGNVTQASQCKFLKTSLF